MKQTNYLQLIRQNIALIISITLLAGAISIWICGAISQSYYESKIELLVIQKENQNLDSYAAQKAAEKLGNNLTKIVYSSDFLDKAIATGLIDKSLFYDNPLLRKKQWEKLVKAQVVPETGIIKVYGYGENQDTAKNIAMASAKVLTENSGDYYGSQDVTIKVIDQAITSNLPAKPNIILNTLIAMVIGFIGSISLVILIGELKNIQIEKEEISYQPLNPVFPVSRSDNSRVVTTAKPVSAVEQSPTNQNPTNIEEMPFYQVLNHQTFPNELATSFAESQENSEKSSVSMDDYMK